MKCSNSACRNEEFKVTIEHRESKKTVSTSRIPVKLVCAKCGKPVKAWITNEQMKQLLKLMKGLADSQVRMATIMATQPKRPWWKFW